MVAPISKDRRFVLTQGQNLQLWFVEGREFRSDNAIADSEQNNGAKHKKNRESMTKSDLLRSNYSFAFTVSGSRPGKGKTIIQRRFATGELVTHVRLNAHLRWQRPW
jgi:hypothetical protein